MEGRVNKRVDRDAWRGVNLSESREDSGLGLRI